MINSKLSKEPGVNPVRVLLRNFASGTIRQMEPTAMINSKLSKEL